MTDDSPAGATGAPALSHVRDDGSAHMVDVTAKAETKRVATARAVLTTRADVVAQLAEATVLVHVPVGVDRLDEGDEVVVWALDDR